jgi:hypothetical protein
MPFVPARGPQDKAGQSMFNGTPYCVIAKRLLHNVLDTAERKIFADVDLDSTARGWLVHRDGPFSRTYRDPRWCRVPTLSDRREEGRQS